ISVVLFLFFFSSRRRHTRFSRDWSSDVCSSDLDLGVLEGAAADLVDTGAYKPFYPHQTSHWLGLDVHDVGDYSCGGEARVLEPGMVLTIEPGLYFRPGGDPRASAYEGIGVRIEDDVLVTESGSENLT